MTLCWNMIPGAVNCKALFMADVGLTMRIWLGTVCHDMAKEKKTFFFA